MSLAKLAVLGVLMEKPMHGYELKQYFETRMPVFWMINYGSIYPVLKKLKEEGLVAARREVSEPRGKIVYEITEEGRREFRKILKERIKKEVHVRDEFTLHLFFLDYLGSEEIKDLLIQKKQGNERLLAHLTEKGETLKKILPRHRFSAIERGIMHVKTELEWLNKTIGGAV
ncbi:MAG: PadR family transcriptional regulator [Euryarchaeota archaeon]|nr:PadR family transcriptional regulator [Euryarchaeota archaeon]